MGNKNETVAPVIFRIDEKEKKRLEAEAAAEGRSLSNYVKHLIATHPKRQKK